MDQKTTYEITITEKLGHVTIPDMSEMIWSRIEAELDLDPGDIDGGDIPPPATPPVRIIFGGVVLLFIGALFIYFLNSKNTAKDNSNNVTPTERSNTQTTVTTKPPGSARDQPALSNGAVKQAPDAGTNAQTQDDTTNTNGQLATGPIIISPAIDSSGQTGNADPGIVIANPPPPVRKDSLPPQKKRGVRSISSGEYKIES